MTEFSKGKQPVRSHKPSGLRHVEQVPDSDTASPDTQLETTESHYGSEAEDGLELSAEDWALLGRLQSKRSDDGTRSSQPPLPLTQTFGISKPASATPVEPSSCFGFARRTTNNTPPKEDASALQHSTHPDTIVSSVEQAANAANKQNASTALVPLPTLPLPTIEQPTTIEQSKNTNSHAVGDQLQVSTSSKTATPIDVPDTGRLKSEPSTPNAVSNSTSHTITQFGSVLKETRSGAKAKKGKKMLLSRPLVPWPPRHGSASRESSVPSGIDSSVNSGTMEHEAEANLPHNDESLTVTTQQSYQHALTNRMGVTGNQSEKGTMVSLDAAVSTGHATNEPHVEESLHGDSSGATQHRVRFSPAVQESINVTGHSDIPEGQSFYASQDGHVAPVQLHQVSNIDGEITAGTPFACSSTFHSPNVHPKPRPALKTAPQQTRLDRIQTPPPRSDVAQNSLRGLSSRDGSIRVTKAQKKTRPVQNVHARASNSIGNSRTLSGMTALDIALDSIRTACIVDQDRMQDQMASTVNLLKEDKIQLQSTMLEQQTMIAELRVQLRTSEENLARLIEKAKTNQRYVAGLQKDYEKCQKSALDFQKQNKQVLEDKISELVNEKASLQGAIDSTIESFTKARNKMMKTIEETHMHYVITLSTKKDLRERLSEQVRLYEEEKCRRTELEKQLLPSLQSMQRQLSESSAALIDKLNGLGISLESRAADDRDDCGIRDCLQILQKLESMPLLTSHDFQKAEGMLRFIQERTDAGLEHLAETSKSKPFPIEEIRQYTYDQIQGLRTEILRHDQAIADGNLARMTSESLRLELDNQRQNQHRLEEQISLLRQSELTLKTQFAQLEKEKDELQAAVRDHEIRPREFERKAMQLQDQLSQAKADLLLANDAAKQKERLRQEQVLEFRKYRLSTLVHYTDLKEQMRQMMNKLQINECEKNVLEKDIVDLKTKLEAIQTNHDRLTVEASQHKSTIDTLRQENDRLSEKYGTSQMSLRSVEDKKLALEAEKEELSTTLKNFRMSMCEASDVEARLTTQCLDLQRQLDQLEDANKASDEQLHQAQHESTVKLQQAKKDHATEIEDLTSRLNLSENARKESQAKVRQMEVAHKQQIECHDQEANAKFERLVLESERGREELEARHVQELGRRQQEATTKTKELERRIEEMRNGMSGKTLIPNSQPPFTQDATPAASPQPQAERPRKKIDRQTDSILAVAPLSNWRFHTDRRVFTADRSNLPHNRCEGSEHQTGFFEEEYRNRFGSQVLFQEHETKPSLIDPDIEVIPETQESEYVERSTGQFGVIESQVSVTGNVNPDDNLSDLSTMPSEDLSEMLLDARSNPGRGHASSRHLSPKDAMKTTGRSGHDLSQDAHSTTSQSRPKSQANTASRMMPLSTSDIQRQHRQTHDVAQHHMHVRSDRTFKADDNDSPDFMHTINALSKQTYGHRPSAHDNSRAGNAETSQKRKALSSHTEQDAPFKKLRNSAQCYVQRPSSMSKNNSPCTSVPSGASIHAEIHPSPSSATSRRSKNRQATNASSQAGTPLLSSTRNTRSKTNRYADRFGQELDRR